MEFQDKVADYGPKLEALQRKLALDGVEFIQVHTVDTSGAFRSKITPLKLSPYGEAINAILYCVAHGDGQPMGDVAFASPTANEENGFPKIKGIIDPAGQEKPVLRVLERLSQQLEPGQGAGEKTG